MKKKERWADIPDDAPLPKWPPDENDGVVVSKHGVKVKRPSPSAPLKPEESTKK